MSDRSESPNGDEMIPLGFHLGQNYPNPFNERTRIIYCIPFKTEVFITIHDLHGELVKRLVEERQTPGTYEVQFDGRNLPEGTYYCRMKAGEYFDEKKMDIRR